MQTDWCRLTGFLGIILLAMASSLGSQQRAPMPGGPQRLGGPLPGGLAGSAGPSSPAILADDTTPTPNSLSRKMLKANYEQLQKDTGHLAELATDLKNDVDNAGEDTLSLSGVKKAEEIEKLAKKIKDHMKSL